MDPFGIKATTLATIVATFLCIRAVKKKSLTKPAAVVAFFVGFACVWTGLRGLNLVVFYLIAIKATRYKKEKKATIEGSLALLGPATNVTRGVGQVLACSLLAVIFGLIHGYWLGPERAIHFDYTTNSDDNDTANDNNLASSLACGIVAHHATCLADTLASELGILSASTPVLITQPWKTVPSGTNGGVTSFGFICSALGGLIIGVSTILFDYISGISPLNIIPMILFGTTCGLAGSMIDSILGATIQISYYDDEKKLVYQADDDGKPSNLKRVVGMNILNNEQVNMVSVAMTTFLGGWIIGPMFFS